LDAGAVGVAAAGCTRIGICCGACGALGVDPDIMSTCCAPTAPGWDMAMNAPSIEKREMRVRMLQPLPPMMK
jgi:hypothetical protein